MYVQCSNLLVCLSVWYFPQVRSLTLFVTHYPVLAQLESTFPGAVGNFHMSYVETGITGQCCAALTCILAHIFSIKLKISV